MGRNNKLNCRYPIVIGIITAFTLISASGPAWGTQPQVLNNMVIPDSFANALRDGVTIPIFLQYAEQKNLNALYKYGSAFIFLQDNKLKIRNITPDDDTDNNGPQLKEGLHSTLARLDGEAFDTRMRLNVANNASLHLDIGSMRLLLDIDQSALETTFISRYSDLGKPSVTGLSNILNYNLGVYSSNSHYNNLSTNSFLSLKDTVALREHHLEFEGSAYNSDNGAQSEVSLYRAMYVRDYEGRRFTAGQLDGWGLQSLAPIRYLNSGKVLGFSYGNQADSTVFNSGQSITPVVVFLPAAGEVHVRRDGRLLSIQNFLLGSHEIDTRSLPYGSYSIDVDVVVNGKVINHHQERINKFFEQQNNGSKLYWQFWGGELRQERWRKTRHHYRSRDGLNYDWNRDPAESDINNNGSYRGGNTTYLAGVSASGGVGILGWSMSGYSFDNIYLSEGRFSLPFTDNIQFSGQEMLSSDSSWMVNHSLSMTLPGGFSSLWLSMEKSRIGNKLAFSDVDTRSLGGSLNLATLFSGLGSVTASYNDDIANNARYLDLEYFQPLYTGRYGAINLRAGMQHSESSGYSSSNVGKFVSLDFSVPLGNWFSAGLSSQNGVSQLNLEARKSFEQQTVREVGVSIAKAMPALTDISGDSSMGAYTRFESRYVSGNFNVRRSSDGYTSGNFNANGSVAWHGKELVLNGDGSGNSGVIIKTGLPADSKMAAKVDGQIYELTGSKNYLSLPAYRKYQVELMNSGNSEDSYSIAAGKKTGLTLYPGNVALIEPTVKQMVTVSGRLLNESGTIVKNAYIKNHIGQTYTDENGEFIMDIDKKYPTINFADKAGRTCEAELDLSRAQGAAWVGNVVCEKVVAYAEVGHDGEGQNAG